MVFVKGKREERRGEEGKYYQCDYGTKGMGGACLGGGGGAYHLGFVGN